jgi:hypothetical protein
MRVKIDFEIDGEVAREETMSEVHVVLAQLDRKIFAQMNRSHSVCKALEADDVLRNSVGSIIGRIHVTDI